jgi:hypothetical protein
MLDLELHPDIFGEVPAVWIPSRAANITLQVICIDGSGHESKFEVSNRTVNASAVEVHDDSKPIGPNEESTESSLAPIIAIGAIFAVIAILVLLITLLSRRGEDEKWSANIDEIVSTTDLDWTETTTLQAEPQSYQQAVLTTDSASTGTTSRSEATTLPTTATSVGTTPAPEATSATSVNNTAAVVSQTVTTTPPITPPAETTTASATGVGAGAEPTPAAISSVGEGTNQGERVDLEGVNDSESLSGEQVSEYPNGEGFGHFDLDPV